MTTTPDPNRPADTAGPDQGDRGHGAAPLCANHPDSGQVSGQRTGERTADSPVSGRTANRLGAAFYLSVAAIALAGQALAAVRWLSWPLLFALPAVAVLELGGIALAARADFRRRLGERAVAARLLSAAVALFAVVFNWVGHDSHIAGGFFAGMSALGYGVWLINAGDRRRDQLRADRKLPPTPPAYEVWQWVVHPLVTRRARALAKADPSLGLYESLTAAELAIRTEKRTKAIANRLQVKMTAATDPVTAKIAVHTYDLDEIARRLAAEADYDGLTALIAADLTPDRLAASADSGQRRTRRLRTAPAAPALSASSAPGDSAPAPGGQVGDVSGDSPADRGADTPSGLHVVASNGQRTDPAVRCDVSVEVLADTLDRLFPDSVPGRPKALPALREVHGSCSTTRAIAAIRELSARRESAADSSDDKERSA